MSRVQLYLLPLLAGGVFLLSGSFEPMAAPVMSIPGVAGEQSVKPWAGETRPLPAALSDVTAAVLLDRAAAQYSPEKTAWLNLTFRQHVAYDEIHFELEGRFLGAPGDRARYELKVKIGAETSGSVTVCDGAYLVTLTEMPAHGKSLTSLPLPRIQQATDNPADVAAARQALLRGKLFPGLAPLLAALRAGFVEAQVRSVTVGGQEFLQIRGRWQGGMNSSDGVPEELRLRGQVGECRVYLDAASLWPRCVEWWGEGGVSAPLLVQTIYDLTSVNQPLSAEQALQEFTLSP